MAGEDGEGEDEQQRLRERIVGAERGLLKRQPDAWVAEDGLDEDEATDRGAELSGEAGQGGRIAFRPAYIVITRLSRRPFAWAIAT